MNRSSRRDPRAYLWDAIEASNHALRFVTDKTRDDYADDVLLRSGVERQLSIVGEALNQLGHVDPDLASRIAELRSVVGFRNVLVHGYREVDELRGPTSGVVRLPLRIYWSGPNPESVEWDTGIPTDRLWLYEIVLREGDLDDVRVLVDGQALIDLWDDLYLPRWLRGAWSPLVESARSVA